MKQIGIILLGIFLATPSWARLGETPDSCDKLYGSPVAEKGPAGCWTLSRDYKTQDFTITARFITLSTGTRVVGWISFTSRSRQTGAKARDELRRSSSSTWAPVRRKKITPDMTPEMQELNQVHNGHVAQTKSIIKKIAGDFKQCWMSPTAYAADDGTTLILFSDIYRMEFDRTPIAK
jgi:hypothetical protein